MLARPSHETLMVTDTQELGQRSGCKVRSVRKTCPWGLSLSTRQTLPERSMAFGYSRLVAGGKSLPVLSEMVE